MARFKYTVISRAGDLSHGKIDADSKELARKRLQQKRLQVVRLSRDWASIEITASKVSIKEMVVFTRQLAAMTDAGLPLTRTLGILYEQAESKKMRTVIQQILVSVESGETLSAALAHHPGTFPDMYVKLVLAGESSGEMASSLEKLADFLERSEEINQRVKGAFVYPIMVTLITMIAMGILYVFVIPAFEEMFKELPTLPTLTRINLKVSQVVRSSPLLVLAGLVGAIAGIRYAFVNPITRSLVDRWGLMLPVIGNVIRKSAIARFSSTLATLLGSGVTLIDALLLCSDTAGNSVVKGSIDDARRAVIEGSDLASPLRRGKVFPPMVTSMIKVGEETGGLQEMLNKVSEFYEKDVKATIDGALEMIKPATMIFLALLVGMVLISVYLPLFDTMVSFGAD